MNENIGESNINENENNEKEITRTWDELAKLKLQENSSIEATKYANESTLIQTQVFHLGFVMGAEWQREQLLDEKIIEEAARATHNNDIENGFAAHSWGQNHEIDDSYRSNTKAAINAILRVKQEQAENIQKMMKFEEEIGEPL